MRRANRILLVMAVFAIGLQDAHASLWGHGKTSQPAAGATAKAAGMSLTSIDTDAGHVTLHTTAAPAYTSYSPSPLLFIVDLTAASKGQSLAIPTALPAGVTSVTADETTEMGEPLTRITFHLSQPMALQASANDSSVTVSVPPGVVAAAAAAVRPAPAVTTPAPAPMMTASVANPPAPEATLPDQPPAPEVVAAPRPAAAPTGRKATTLEAIGTTGTGASMEVGLAGNGAMAYKAFRLENPARLVVDLNGVRNATSKTTLDVGGSLVHRVRVSQFKSDVTRVVLDLAAATQYDIVPDGDRLRIVFGAGAMTARSQTAKHPAATQTASRTISTPAPRPETAVHATPDFAAPVATSTVVSSPAEDFHASATTAEAPAKESPAATTVAMSDVAPVVPPPPARAVITANVEAPPPDTSQRPATTSTAPPGADNVFSDAPSPAPVLPAGNQVAATPGQPALLSGGIQGSQGGRVIGGNQKVYSGEPITLNLKDADIRDVLRTFHDLTGLNIAIDPQVNGTVTVDFTDVPWDQALDVILNQNGLTWVLSGNVMRVGTVERIAAERQATRRLDEEERLNVPLETYIFKLSYARATDVQALLKDLASPRAKIIMDSRTNQLIVSDIPSYLRTIANLIETVDVPTKQVTIEARIVEATKTFIQQYGFSWGFNGAADPALGTGTGLVFPNRIAYTGGPFDFGPGNPILTLGLSDVLGTFNLDFALNATEFEGLAKVISAPKVTTQDNVAASIESGFQIPYQTRVNFTTTIQYLQATLRLEVTPQITESGTVIMDIAVQKNDPTTGLAVEGSAGAPISTRSAKTRLMVRDGGTAVIGGIYQVKDNNSQTRLPFIYQIPVLGNLFKTHDINTTNDELLIFITPRIIRGV